MKRIIKRKMMVGENLLKIELMRPSNIDKVLTNLMLGSSTPFDAVCTVFP